VRRMGHGRSLWFVAPGRVEIKPSTVPPLEDGDVLLRTIYSGISTGTELLAFRGELDPELAIDETIGALGGTFSYPFRYGYSCVAVVEESRSNARRGDVVFVFHPHDDLFVAPAAHVIPLGSVNAREATLYPYVETALQITLDAGPVLDDTVVVIGLGVVGALTSVLLQRAGAHVVAVEPRAARRAVAASMGVPAVEPDALPDALAAAGRPTHVPLVIESSGNPDALAGALPLLAHEGMALVASWYGTKPVTLPLGQEFHRRRLTIRSTQVSTIPARLSDRWDVDRRRRSAVAFLDELPLDRLASHEFPFEDAAEAYRALDAGEMGVVHAALRYA
jgi:2-desacetyl-2-hydroxyethyl bacteriochlorophyllide A dehydrogenase